MTRFENEISCTLFNLVYAFDCPNDQVDTLNRLLSNCINEHAPIKKCKFTRPPAPWMKDLDINQLQIERNRLRKIAHQTQSEQDWNIFRDIRNKLKRKIQMIKHQFYTKAL